MLAVDATRELKKRSNKSQAVLAQRFFKTSKGEYGYDGDTIDDIRNKITKKTY